ncbi:Spy/CpxP family protein refolding chaperone [Shewanella yunxiaonensis]|uniref:Spy/CpxP family protein refolding chaperone n=1 Tax=Shewanella yunxiaonensis TaxID=2829809 RepID=A0ABX7YSH9_9GAMM|nr:Spy/CpxP family protein refolding chaperone [Shewanella yunxiaonensis]QUN05748.1 Spy/CpxP family protein refolding chaperone [Shewanella yunxiaonensis]
MVNNFKTGMLVLATVSGIWATTAFAADTDKAKDAPPPPAAPACQCPKHMGMGPGMMQGQGMGPGPGMMQGPGMGPGMHGGFRHGMGGGWDHMGFMMLHQLELTDAQQTAIKKLFDAQRDSMKAERSAHRKAMQELMTATKFDESKAKKLIEQQQQLRTERQLQRMKLHNQIYNLLTDEQKTKLKSEMEKMPMWNADQDD